MRIQLLEILQCPYCGWKLDLSKSREDHREIRLGQLACSGPAHHCFDIRDGIVYLGAGLSHAAVQKELAYENSSYHGSPRLTDPDLISGFPDTLPQLWPHTLHFGPDFRVLMDRIDIHPKDWVLDIGTGPCWSSRLLAQRGARVIALDVNDADFYGLKTADHLFDAHDVYFDRVLESMTCLPFADGSIDRITFNASFHHTPDHRQTLNECHRILKPGGSVAMVNEELGSWRQRFFSKGIVTDEGSHHTVDYSDLESAARRAGFQIHYQVAGHVQQKIEQHLPRPLARGAVAILERFPIALKQLNSALVLLEKPPSEREESTEFEMSGALSHSEAR